MAESAWHKNTKREVADVAEILGYSVALEFESPRRMAFQTYTGKSRIDVWCEFKEKRDGVWWGRQIPVEVDYSERIGFEGYWDESKKVYESDDLDRYKEVGVMPAGWARCDSNVMVDPRVSIRMVVSHHVAEPWLLLEDEPYPYQLLLVPRDHELIQEVLAIGSKYLMPGFESKIKQIGLDKFGV